MGQVENRQGLENFASIVGRADGIILSRGNLGLDVLSEKMAMVQKVRSQPVELLVPSASNIMTSSPCET